MAKKPVSERKGGPAAGKPSPLVDTRVIYCGDNLDQLKKLPEECVDLIYIDPPFNSNRNYEVFWGETKEKRAFEDRHASLPTRSRPSTPISTSSLAVCSRSNPALRRHPPHMDCLIRAFLTTLPLVVTP